MTAAPHSDPVSVAPDPRRRPGGVFRLWRGIGHLLTPFLGAWLNRRVRLGKEDPSRLGERFGLASRSRPAGRLTWVHAASVGETLSVLPLIRGLVGPGRSVLLTTGTLTSARLADQRLPPGAVHQFVPLDAPGAAATFLDHWRPDLALFVESDLWPTLIGETMARGIPFCVVNARMSDRSFTGWRRFPRTARQLFGRFDLVFARSPEDAERFTALGSPAVIRAGDLKLDAAPLPVDREALAELRAEIDGRPVLVAASTHPGEDEQILSAARLAGEHVPGLMTILVPRHPERGPALVDVAWTAGFTVARRSAGERIQPGTGVYVADTIGEMGLFYRLADVAFVGGSLVAHGGQNPLEAARLGLPIITGPHMENFAEIVARLSERGGLVRVADGAGVARAVVALFADPVHARRVAEAAAAVAEEGAGAVDRVLATLRVHMPWLADPQAGAPL